MVHDTKMDIIANTAYVLNGITYLPHYSEISYVRPGYGQTHYDTYSEKELIALGAKPVSEALWPRANNRGGRK